MANGALWLGLAVFVILLVSVLGSVERRERYAFAAGVVVLLAGQLLAVPPLVGAVAGLVGIVVVFASAVPLLFEDASPT